MNRFFLKLFTKYRKKKLKYMKENPINFVIFVNSSKFYGVS